MAWTRRRKNHCLRIPEINITMLFRITSFLIFFTCSEILAKPIDLFFGTGGRNSEGIYHATFNPENGKFTPSKLAAKIGSPGFLSMHPNGQILLAAGSVDPLQALLIGAIAGILCQEAVNVVRNILSIDDTLDVFAVHGIGGIFGTLMIAIFGYTSFVTQLSGLIIVGIFTVIVTYILIKIVSLITPLRVDEETETNGLDLSVHGERAYDVNS